MLTTIIITAMMLLGLITDSSDATDQMYLDNRAQIEAIIIAEDLVE